MKRSLLVPMLAAAAFAGACGDDENKADTSGDTIDDTGVPVDTSVDTGVPPTDVTLPPDAPDGVDVADTADAATIPDGDDVDTTPSDAADTADTTPPDVGPTIGVVINEISVAGVDPDWIELYNGGASAVDIGGWILRDDDPLHGYTLPAGTTLPAGAYLAIDQGDGTTGFDFGFGDQDGAFLFDRDDTAVDDIAWIPGEAPAGATYGRLPNGSGNFKTLWVPTKGLPNVDNPITTCGDNTIEPSEFCDGTDIPDGYTCQAKGFGGGTLGCAACKTLVYDTCTPHAAALVVNEVSAADDKIELFNGTNAGIQLGGYQIKDDADNTYTFPTRTINANGYVVLTRGVEFDFGLGGNDAVILLNATGTELDRADWIAGEAEISYCRSPNGTGGFEACEATSFGQANP